jgi:protein-S-isoprenylcysteine O-methyltransferase Ste14
MSPQTGVGILWIAWMVSWFAGAIWSDRSVARPGRGREIPYTVLTITGAILMFGLHPRDQEAGWVLWQLDRVVGWALVAVALFGLLFTWWARIHLGRLWSRNVARKADHHLVDTGPYALTRHPIYTGIILATLATAVLRGSVVASLGFVCLTVGWYVKARLEERFLREQLGAPSYDAYAKRVPMLIPFV